LGNREEPDLSLANRNRFPIWLLLILLLPVIPPVKAAGVSSVAIVMPGDKSDFGWNQQATGALDSVTTAGDLNLLVRDKIKPDKVSDALKDLQDKGAQLIICHAPAFTTACSDFARSGKVPVAVSGSPRAVVPNLVSDIEIQPQEAAYLAGVLAGRSTVSGMVGIVVSDESTMWNLITGGFAQGLKASNGSARLLYTVLNPSTGDAVKAKDAVNEQLDSGADIILGMDTARSTEMIDAVQKHNKDHKDSPARFIDVEGVRGHKYADVVLTSILFDFYQPFAQMIADIDSQTFGKIYTMNLQNDQIRLLDLPVDTPEPIATAVTSFQAKLVSGQLKVAATEDADEVRAKLEELGYR